MRSVQIADVHLEFGVRELEKFDESQAILMTLYICVLALCCVTPFFYLIRLKCEDRNVQHLRRLEAAAITAALQESQQNREENRAARRKYTEERRARILQLFRPVRMTLTEEHFVCEVESRSNDTVTARKCEEDQLFSSERKCEFSKSDELVQGPEVNQQIDSSADIEHGRDLETGNTNAVDITNPYGEEEARLVQIPVPGLYTEKTETRLVPGTCTICLCDYEPGSDVVWSSSNLCEHVFHAECIEAWLMKQREGPLCPCCRRDFIIDPYDCDAEEGDFLGIEQAYSLDSEDVEIPIRRE